MAFFDATAPLSVSWCLFLCHLFDSGKRALDRRNTENQYGNYAFNQDVRVVIDNRIDGGQSLREAVRHVIHPVQVTADGMESTSKENTKEVSLDEAVFLAGKHTGKAQCGKGKKVVAAYLKRSQYVGAALLDELQNAVSKCDGETGAQTVPVAD